MSYLNSELHRDWKTNGYLKIPRFFSAEEVANLQAWVSEISDWEPTSDKWMHHYESTPDGPRLSRSENFVPYHTDMKSHRDRWQSLSRRLRVNAKNPQSSIKRKSTTNTPAAGVMLPIRTRPAYEFVDYHITCLISVDSATAKSGCLYFSPGRHLEGFIALDEKGCIAPETASMMGMGRRADRSGRHSPFRLLHPTQKSGKPFRATETYHLSHLQCYLTRRLAREVLCRQTGGILPI